MRMEGGLAPPAALRDASAAGYYAARFSPECGFYWLAKLGPDVPQVEIVKVDEPTYRNVLEDNAALAARLARSRVPTVVTTELQVGNLSASRRWPDEADRQHSMSRRSVRLATPRLVGRATLSSFGRSVRAVA